MSYVPSTGEQRREMLAALGMRDVRELYRDVPSDMLLDKPLDIPEGMSELEVNRAIAKALSEAGADVTYEEGEGMHDWFFWDTYIQHVLKWLDYSGTAKE